MKGSSRYQDPAYICKKERNGQTVAVIVTATELAGQIVKAQPGSPQQLAILEQFLTLD